MKFYYDKKDTLNWLQSQLIAVTARRGLAIATGNFDKLVRALWVRKLSSMTKIVP